MYAETIYSTLFIAALVYWMWRANKSRKTPDVEPEPEGMSFAGGHGEKGEEPDPFLQNVHAERITAESQARGEAHQYKKSVEAQVQDDEKLKARLAKFAKNNNLDTALPQLWDELRNYPTWSKRDDWQQWNKLGIQDPTEEKFKDLDNKAIHFGYEGTRYTITTKRWNGMETTTYMDFHLLENDEEVFAVSAEEVHDDYMTYYRPWDIKAFKRRGNWATMLVRLNARRNLESEKSSADTRARMASDIKERFTE